MAERTRNRLTETDTRPETKARPTTGDGDHDRFAHYVKKEDILKSAVEGMPVVALCGKVWVPNRDPERYPVCPTCKEIMAKLKGLSGSGEPD